MATTINSLSALPIFGLTLLAFQFAQGPKLTKQQNEILGHMSIVRLDDGQGGLRKTLRISGVNVQLVNGLGSTNGFPSDPTTTDIALTSTNGLGNLIIGYDDLPRNTALPLFRTGSHNLVVGFGHNYSGYGGQVVAYENTIGAAYSVVSGGGANRATAELASVSGGVSNVAAGVDSSVSGGLSNQATGFVASVTGGTQNVASGKFSVVSGGQSNLAGGDSSAVSGGGFGAANGFISTVGGGSSRAAAGSFDWAAGALFQDF